jgi:hypothetical protein
MTCIDKPVELLIQKLQQALPLHAHGRTALAAVLQRHSSAASTMPRVMVTDIFYAGEEKGLMCRVDVQGLTNDRTVVVAPLTQLAFDRRHPVTRDIAAYRNKRRAKNGSRHYG